MRVGIGRWAIKTGKNMKRKNDEVFGEYLKCFTTGERGPAATTHEKPV
jgi:hypothetical protein